MNNIKLMPRTIFFGFIVGLIPAFFNIYLYELPWWLIVVPIIIIGEYINDKYFEENIDIFVKRKVKK